MQSKKKLLLYGVTGFIGARLLEFISKHFEQIICPVRNTTQYPTHFSNVLFIDIKEITHISFFLSQVDIVIFGIDDVLKLKEVDSLNFTTYEVNTILDDILSGMTKNQLFLFFSSRLVYDADSCLPVKEGDTLKGRNVYATNKIFQENLIRTKSLENNFYYLILRLTNVYDNKLNDKSRNIINVFAKAIQENKTINVFGSGEQIRDYINISSVVDLIIKLFEKGVVNHTINIGSGHGVSINEILQEFSKYCGHFIIKYHDFLADDEKLPFIADVSKVKTMIDFTQCSLSDDIKKLCKQIMEKKSL